jgi:hypothetical protein
LVSKGKSRFVIPALRKQFNRSFTAERYKALRALLDQRSAAKVEFRVAETPVFVTKPLLEQMAAAGASLASRLIANAKYLEAARRAIPHGFCVSNETRHPHFLTADFALVRNAEGNLVPRLVEIQAFPSVFGYQAILCAAYRECFDLQDTLGVFLGELNEEDYWKLLSQTILGGHDPENVVLTEVDPLRQKTLPDFKITAQRVGIRVVDIATVEAVGDTLHYRNAGGRLTPIRRIYNRAIADELIARKIQLRFDPTHSWNVEWAGHPNWYFLISKFSVPWLSRWERESESLVPPAVFLDDFLGGAGRAQLEAAGVELPEGTNANTVYSNLLLKPLFSFAGKGIQFDPEQAQLEAIAAEDRPHYLLQQRMYFEPAIETPHGLTQAEFRILYLWPDGGKLTPALSLVRLGRGKMMGVDHNKNQQWVGASAAFYPPREDQPL